ncbi:MAG: hypothetical protein GY711_31520 [bacterium]|nr:hypothetical protein [bacterium]
MLGIVALAALLLVRRGLALPFGLLAIAFFVGLGEWRGRAGHDGLGTIDTGDTGWSLDGHGTSKISRGTMTAAIGLGLALELWIALAVLRRRIGERRGPIERGEIVFGALVFMLLIGAVRLLRFDPLTRLHRAAGGGRAAVVARILERDPALVDAPHFHRYALWRAATQGDAEVVRTLLDAGADPRLRGPVPTASGSADPFVQAARGGHLEAARLVLRAGGVIDAHLLHWAAREKRADVVRLLAEEGADVNAVLPRGEEGETALFHARSTEVVRALLELGTSPATGYPLSGVVGDLESVRLLVEAGAEVDEADFDGRTPLSRASLEVARYLLERGADPDLGHALHHAVQRGRLPLVTLLLEGGADVDARDADGKLPLDLARNDAIRAALRDAR